MGTVKNYEEAMTTGTISVAFHFNGGAVLAAHRRGTVDSDTVFYDYCYEEAVVPMKLGTLGTTRAYTLAGESGEVIRSIEEKSLDRLVKAENAKEPLETVKVSAEYLARHFGGGGGSNKPHVETIVAGWDNVDKEGAPCIWYGNHTTRSFVAENKAIGPGHVYVHSILGRHKVGMSEEEVVKFAEVAILQSAKACDDKGGSLDVWVIKDGKILKKESQLMTEIEKKYGDSFKGYLTVL